MWLSRAGVIEQADSGGGGIPPTVTNAGISDNPNLIEIATSEDCNFSTTTGITVSSDIGNAITITAIQGSGSNGRLTVSRPIAGTETITLAFAGTNGITSVASGLSIAEGQVAVTNNARPSVTNAEVTLNFATQSSNTITITMNEPCTYTLNTPPKIMILSTAPAAISITSVTGSGTTGTITLSRNVTSADTLTLRFSPPNGIVSSSNSSSPDGDVSVTNNTGAAGINFQNITWSSASAGTSVISQGANPINQVFPPQASGLKVSYPNWVGYGAAGSAVTDTQIVVKANLAANVPYGFSTGADITTFGVILSDSNEHAPTPPLPTGSNVPYFSPTNSGTASATQTSKLVNTTTGNDFSNTVVIGDKVINQSTGNSATVTAIDNSTTLSLSADIMSTGNQYIIQTREMTLNLDELSNISLPTVNPRVGKTPAYIDFDILSLLSAGKGEPVTLEYTDAVPANSSNQGSQMSSFSTRVRTNFLDVSGNDFEIDVETSSDGSLGEGGTNAQSGPVTVVPRLHSVQVNQAGEQGVIYGLAYEANNWNLGDFGIGQPGAPPPQLGGGEADIILTLQFNPYVYNNLTAPEPDPLRSATLSSIQTITDTGDTFTFDNGAVTFIEDYQAQPNRNLGQPDPTNVGYFADVLATGTILQIVGVEGPFGAPLIPGMEISSTAPGITIPSNTVVTAATPYYEVSSGQWVNQITVNNTVTVTGSGTFKITSPNLGYINISLSDFGSAGGPQFPGPNPANPFSFSIDTPAGIQEITYNGFNGERTSTAPANYITRTISGTYPPY